MPDYNSNDQAMGDPNQFEAIRRRSACLDYMTDVMLRGNGIHTHDAQVLSQLVSNLYRILPIHNTEPVRIGDLFQEARHDLLRRIEDLGVSMDSDSDEYAWEVWRENEHFIESCTTFMNDTLFVKPAKQRKAPTEGKNYD